MQIQESCGNGERDGGMRPWSKLFKADISGRNRIYSAVLNQLWGGLCMMLICEISFYFFVSGIKGCSSSMILLVLGDRFRLPQATEEEGAELEELGSLFGAYSELVRSLFGAYENPIPQYRDLVFADFRSILWWKKLSVPAHLTLVISRLCDRCCRLRGSGTQNSHLAQHTDGNQIWTSFNLWGEAVVSLIVSFKSL